LKNGVLDISRFPQKSIQSPDGEVWVIDVQYQYGGNKNVGPLSYVFGQS